MKRFFLLAGAVAGILILSFTFTLDVGDPKWQKTVLDNQTVGFVDLEVKAGTHVVARTEEGLEYFHKESKIPVLGQKSFTSELIDGRRHTGSYASLEVVNGDPAVAYQYAKIADETAVYAEKENRNWSREKVSEPGRNNGMYTDLVSYQEEPLIFYTNDYKEPLKLGKDTSKGWKEQVVERGKGLIVDAEECGGKLKAAYAERGSNQLYLGTYDGSWSSRKLNLTATSLDLSLSKECDPSIVIHSDSRNSILLWENGRTERIDKSLFSRVSSDRGKDGMYLMYGKRDSGLFFGKKGNVSKIASGRDVGAFNDLEMRGSNRYAVYTDGSELVYAEYNVSETKTRKTLLKIVQGILAILTILALVLMRGERISKIISRGK